MFSGVPSPMEEAENSPGPTALRSFQERRKGFESPSNTPPGLTPKKPAVPKPVLAPKAPANEVKPPLVKPVGGINRTAVSPNTNIQAREERTTFPKPSGFKTPSQQTEEPKFPFPKPISNKPFVSVNNASQEAKFGGLKPTFPPEPKGTEEKPPFPKPSQLKSVNYTSENESKPPFQKKPPFGAKPPINVGGSPSENSFNKHNLVAKTFSGSPDNKPIKQIKESTEENMSGSPSSQPFHGVPLRPSGIKQLQSPFLNKSTEEPNGSPKPSSIAKDFQMKTNQNGNSSSPFGLKHPRTSSVPDNLEVSKDPNEPKRKPFPSLAKLGPPPQKPTRPPNVDIEKFRKRAGGKVLVSEQKSSALSSALPPPPPIKSPLGPVPVPNLPPRNIRLPEPIMPDDDNYDDVEGPAHNDISEESEGEEVYDELDEPRKEQEKDEKKRKKELEQARKEQKEKEKKEQEIRKKFKLVNKIEVIHQVKASVDHKGGKNELSFKNGDEIEIIRVTDNPEGKWLGRMNGIYGYIKTTMVNVDYDSLRRRKTVIMTTPVKHDSDQEIYDDVGEDEASNKSAGNSFFPPPPSNDDIYDGVDDDPHDSSVPQEEEKSGTWSWFKKRKGTQQKQKHVSEKTESEEGEDEFSLSHSSIPDSDVYDDVETDFPPPPIESSLFMSKRTDTLGRSPDYKTLKKLEKEEKDFRKKFKFTGDIRVLSTVQVVLNLSTKKWGSKDLPLKAGETLDVLQLSSGSTLLCRNNEGKYGYVLRSNIIDHDDGEIYDDIGEDCIYDND
ncbi:FYN-binding protein 1 isoform X2 [Aquarana catesbeiana]